MSTYVLLWNPSKWAWPEEDLQSAISQTLEQRGYTRAWSTGNRHRGIAPGDRALLLRQGDFPGLVAVGTFTSGIDYQPHWDGSGRAAPYAWVLFDRVLPADDRLLLETLKTEVSEFPWAELRGGGAMVPEQASVAVERLWLEHLAGSISGSPRAQFFGEIPGIGVGASFDSYAEMKDVGLHGVTTQGIWSRKGIGVGSIVLNGGYPDDEDYGDVIYYTGAGGQDSRTKKQIADQVLNAGQNAALDLNRQRGLPVRVIRGWKGDPDRSPSSGYRYDGLYEVRDSWIGKGSAEDTRNFDMVTFLLAQLNSDQSTSTLGTQAGGSSQPRRRLNDPEVNRAVERRAIDVTLAYFTDELGMCVRDVGIPGSPYDLVAVDASRQLRIEVKGRVSSANTVDLTYREVEAAQDYSEAVLAVVDEIDIVHGPDGPAANGGRLRLWMHWHPAPQDLLPTTFRYSLPALALDLGQLPAQRLPGSE